LFVFVSVHSKPASVVLLTSSLGRLLSDEKQEGSVNLCEFKSHKVNEPYAGWRFGQRPLAPSLADRG
jgi:hypothetical protein